ncbi:Hypothetical predicted protein [Cloeon dipterum]|uniref:Uncharacterized protein n=1 Tax=Cloeon dipterum TaxID=197152 RepID=A0A8S1DWE6_9INSE|nr:Hypothetical predicted protein [Cloeon dipterum]
MTRSLVLLAVLTVLIQGILSKSAKKNEEKTQHDTKNEKFIDLDLDPEIEQQASLGEETRKDAKAVLGMISEEVGLPFLSFPTVDLISDGVKLLLGFGGKKQKPVGDEEVVETESSAKKQQLDRLKSQKQQAPKAN